MGLKILAGDMWAIYHFGDPNLRYQAFLKQGKPRFQNFFDSCVLYDEIVIPTDDFMSLAVLVGVLGVGPVSDMLDEGLFRLVRAKGALAYIGNGGGLRGYTITSADGKTVPFSAPAEEALLWALGGLNNVNENNAQRIAEKALKNLTEISVRSISDDFRNQTHADISGSIYLKENFGLGNDLSFLPGIEPEGVRIYGGPDSQSSKDDQISTLLKLAHANLEIRLADLTECSDVSTNTPIGHLLRGKQDRLSGQKARKGLTTLKAIADIPDIGTWILNNPNQIDKLLKLRSSSSSAAFRAWFHQTINTDSEGIAKSYVNLLSEIPTLQKAPARAIRFLVTAGWAVAEPISGSIAAVVDNFVIDKFLNNKSPKFFLENLKQLPNY